MPHQTQSTSQAQPTLSLPLQPLRSWFLVLPPCLPRVPLGEEHTGKGTKDGEENQWAVTVPVHGGWEAGKDVIEEQRQPWEPLAPGLGSMSWEPLAPGLGSVFWEPLAPVLGSMSWESPALGPRSVPWKPPAPGLGSVRWKPPVPGSGFCALGTLGSPWSWLGVHLPLLKIPVESFSPVSQAEDAH